MPTTSSHEPSMRQQLSKYGSALTSFIASNSKFRILHSVPSASTTSPPPKTLYVLDSSFNPPTVAHLRIATSALENDLQPSPTSTPKRLLLLLAIQNADKAPQPASFEQRLLMMQIFASDLVSNLSSTSAQPQASEGIAVDIGITTLPYFMDKAAAIDESAAYAADTTQVHLTGFDTLVRVLDPKYYPPTRTLTPLDGFLGRHRLRVAYRTGDQWGGREAQDGYLRELAEGGREVVGGRREWATGGRIALVEGGGEGEEVVSSTKVRRAAKEGDRELLKKLVTDGVAQWILEEGLYLDD